jgi:hypothetical protein
VYPGSILLDSRWHDECQADLYGRQGSSDTFLIVVTVTVSTVSSITLQGSSSQSVECGSAYVDPGPLPATCARATHEQDREDGNCDQTTTCSQRSRVLSPKVSTFRNRCSHFSAPAPCLGPHEHQQRFLCITCPLALAQHPLRVTHRSTPFGRIGEESNCRKALMLRVLAGKKTPSAISQYGCANLLGL